MESRTHRDAPSLLHSEYPHLPWMVMAPSGGAAAYRDTERSMCEWTPVPSVCIMLLYSC